MEGEIADDAAELEMNDMLCYSEPGYEKSTSVVLVLIYSTSRAMGRH